ncbi:MAG: DNA translocase FtsK 4TM domain-containing protein, partial [Hymenobacteraceae bacterium]|nr:DNA translocase FtsK 4TM domain-containing protein [Hymenobacteraceae bacterium]MDX5394581.1 DNA translocase FtsK 4TM domain-containing protein [Hymenobacteraceae bacterium]MDX5510607.1 DNA translocase FtsK 4TM domain-containing protein [Hymenobacteraceae bacterium]
MAKNTYKPEAINGMRGRNEPKGTNEPKGVNAPKGAKTAKFKNPVRLPLLQLNFFKDRRIQLFAGFFFLLLSLYLTIAFVSYLFTGPADQSVVEALDNTAVKEAAQESENWLGLLGAWLANLFIYEWFGIAAFCIIPVSFFFGYKILFRKSPVSVS